MTPEGRVKNAVQLVLDKYEPVWYFMPVQSGYGKMGIPDFIVCANGNFLAIECKAGKGKVTALQALQLTAITNGGGRTLVIANASETIMLVNWLMELGCHAVTTK